MRARPLVHTAVAAVALVTLAGCQKPTPGVTVSSGATSDHVEAALYCRDGQTIAKGDCVKHLSRTAVIHVKQGEAVGFDVDTSLADHGWTVFDTDAKQGAGVLTGHYWSYTPQFANGPVSNLQIRSFDGTGQNPQVTGVWSIVLVQD